MIVRLVVLLFLSVSCLAVNADVVITGRVVNGASTNLASTKVWLKSHPETVDSTGTDGKFSLSLPTTGFRSGGIAAAPGATFRMENQRLFFSLNAPQYVSLRLFDTRGKLAAVLYDGLRSQGTQSIVISRNLLPHASGAYLLRFRSVDREVAFAGTVVGERFFCKIEHALGRNNVGASAGRAASADTLVVLRMGYEIKKVPMADVASSDVGPITLSPRTYKMAATSTVKQGRVIEVVLPSDYKELYALPVLYLLHGGGEDHTAWRTKGQLIDALNGLQFPEKDQMQAMIIVTPDASSSTGYGNYGKAGDVFYTDLTVDIRKFVESNYKVDTARNARAISGFSMGAMQTHNLTLFYPGMFGFAYPICGGLYKSAGFSEAKMKSDIAGGVIDTALVHSMKAYKLHSNETDIAWTDTRDFEKYLTTVGVKHTYDFTSYSIGGHTFSYCNAVFKKYAIALFK